MKNFIKHNWFKIVLIIIVIFALNIWKKSIENERIYNFLICQKGSDAGQYSFCASFYPDLVEIK